MHNGAVSIPALIQQAGRDTIHFLHHNHALFDRAASWIVNSAVQALPLWLNARSCLGLVTAAELNAFDDQQLSRVNVRILKRLPMDEFLKLKPPVLMTCSDSEVSELLARAKDDSITRSIMKVADNLSAFAETIQVRQLST